MKVVFMGTPEFSVPALNNLIEKHEVIAVVSQPDKPKGRGKAMTPPPVKQAAATHGIRVFQPARVRDEAFIRILASLEPDVIVVAAFGQILPKEILDLPKYGCINIHASLLPKYRGAAPIQWAVINGEEVSGVTTMYMAEGLDTGDMIDKTVVPLSPHETGDSLHDKLSLAGGTLILETLDKLQDGTARRIPQDDAASSYARMLTKELGRIDWTFSAVRIERLIRGLNSWPSAYTSLGGKTLKIWDAQVVKELPKKPKDLPEGSDPEGAGPGTVLLVTKESFYVMTGEDILQINEVQLQGKKRMSAASFLLGYRLQEGTKLAE